MILTPLQQLPKNEEDWVKLIVAKGFKRLPKVRNIAQSGHTVVRPISYKLTYQFALSTYILLDLVPTKGENS